VEGGFVLSVEAKVIGVGHCTVDITCPMDKFPEIDLKTEIENVKIEGGGPSANAMAALAKMGVRTALVSRLGTDILGRFARMDLLRRDIECTHLFMDEETQSPLSVIITEKDRGTRTIIVYKGSNREVDPLWLSDGWIMTGEILHIDGHQLPSGFFAASEYKKAGKTVVFDAGSWRVGTEELLELSTVVIASSHFAGKLDEDPVYALRKIVEYGPELAVITRGRDGAIAYENGKIIESAGFDVDVIDTTGAGDVFHGAFIYAHLAGMSLADRLTFGNAAAAMKCCHLGARGGLPTAEEVMAFLRERDVNLDFAGTDG